MRPWGRHGASPLPPPETLGSSGGRDRRTFGQDSVSFTMPEQDRAAPRSSADLDALQQRKAARLDDLLKCKPGQKHYQRRLRSFLDADWELQAILLGRLGLGSPVEPD